jgi:uroporphyrinogen-III decarboxylase
MLGWDMLLLAAGDDPVRFGALINRYGDWMMRFYEALAESDAKVVMIHDDMVWTSGPVFSPAFYREYIFPNLKRYIQPLRDSGKKVLFTSDGDYTMFIDDVVDCGVHGMVMEPMTSLEYAAEKYGKTHVLIGNADTRILLNGSREQIRSEVERCMSIGRDCPGFFMAVGNHIPPNTPVESALYYNEVYESLSRR